MVRTTLSLARSLAASSSGRNKFRETVLSFLHLDQSTCAADVKLQDSPGHRHSLKKRSTKDLQKLPKWCKVKSLHRFQLGLLLKSSSRFQPGNRSSRYGLIRFPWQFLFSDTVLFDSAYSDLISCGVGYCCSVCFRTWDHVERKVLESVM